MKLLTPFLAFVSLSLVSSLQADRIESLTPTAAKKKVEAAQRAWGAGLVSISKANRTGGDPKAVAGQVLDTLYDFDGVGVVFKPTLTSGKDTFRNTREAALAYFVGGNPSFPGDTGFALNPWVKAKSRVVDVVVSGNVIIAVGNVWLTDKDGKVTKVDKTFGYRVTPDGSLKIISHHSSLPVAKP